MWKTLKGNQNKAIRTIKWLYQGSKTQGQYIKVNSISMF